MFLCRREAWPGFDRRWRGFGGEEGCIHEVFRHRGDRALCHPDWLWVHRFAKPGGVNVPAYTYSKARNYVLGFQRVGRDIDEIRRHLVVELANDPDPNVRRQALSAKDWDYLVAHPDEELPLNVIPMEEIIGIQMSIDVGGLGVIGLICLPMIFLASALQMIIATFARSFKEAQTYVGFLPLVPALPGLGLAFLPVKPALWTMLLPTFGQQILINQVMRGETVSAFNVGLSVVVTLVLAVVLTGVAIRLYEREQILFGKA